ncbi:hypothetical protein D3C76_1250370 [compost metagenome]
MGNVAVEGQAISRLHVIQLIAMAIHEFAFQQVQELGAWMREGGEFFAGVVHGDHVRLEAFLRPACVVEQMIGVAFLCSPAHHLQPFITLDQQGAATWLVVLAE